MKKPGFEAVQHCSEDAVTAYLLGMAERKDCNHIDSCTDCYARVERARIQMRELCATADKLASRPEHFWTRQRAAIMDCVADAKPSFGHRWVWAYGAAVAVLALAAVLVFAAWPIRHEPRVMSDGEDDLLLTQIESDLQRPVPRALEPANLLVRARNEVARGSQRHASGGIQQ